MLPNENLNPHLLEPYQREAFSAVLAEYEEMMAYVLDFSHAGLNLGNLYRNLGRPAEAERYYRDAIAVDDLFYPARVNLAMLLNQQGRNDEAEEELRAVVAAYPDHPDVTYSLALLLVEMNRPADAVDFLERAAAGMPARPRVHYNLGLLRQQLGAVHMPGVVRQLAKNSRNSCYQPRTTVPVLRAAH